MRAGHHREQRDRLIRTLREEGWTYKALAAAVGCSPELIAIIVRGRAPRRRS